MHVAKRAQIPAEEVLRRDDPRWRRLHDIVFEKSFQTGNFILASGVSSNFLFQLRQTTMLAEGATLIAEIVLEYMQRHDIHCIGGLVQGAVPIGLRLDAWSCETVPNSSFLRAQGGQKTWRAGTD